MDDAGILTLRHLRARFASSRDLAERALGQMSDAAFFAALGPLDPAAVVVKHVAGNLRSRWTDFLTMDGDKPDRERDREFVIEPGDTRPALMAAWADAWGCLDAALAGLQPADLARTVTIRAEPMPAVAALHRSLAHTAYHVGQIVLLAKYHAGAGWQTLSIPRGQSEAFAAAARRKNRAG